MKALGRHILAEFYGCTGALDDMKEVERIMVEAALEAGAEVREVAFHKFSPQGVSGVVVISESPPGNSYLARNRLCRRRCFHLR